MPANLDTVPTGSNLLIGANIFVYGLTNASAQCQTLLARCSSEEVYGITLFEVIHEAAHRFMIGEARAKGLFTATEKGAKYLANHPEEVKLLTAYSVNTQRLLALNLVYLPMEEKIVKEAQPGAARARERRLTHKRFDYCSCYERVRNLANCNERPRIRRRCGHICFLSYGHLTPPSTAVVRKNSIPAVFQSSVTLLHSNRLSWRPQFPSLESR